MSVGARAFVQWPAEGEVRERAARGAGGGPELWSFQAPWLRRGASGSLQGWVARALRAASRALWLSPLLLIVRMLPGPPGDTAILAFVAIVVTFFALLNLYVLVALIRHRRGLPVDPGWSWDLPFDARGGDRLGLLRPGPGPTPIRVETEGAVTRAVAGDLVLVRGTARRLPGSPAVPALVADLWSASPAARLSEVVDLVVRARDQVPVVLTCASAPVLLAAPRVGSFEDAREAFGEEAIALLAASRAVPASARVTRLALREGAEVTLLARVERVVDDVGGFRLGARQVSLERPDEGDAPYRQGPRGPGLVVASTPGEPAILLCRG